jgi:hypothetical protein
MMQKKTGMVPPHALLLKPIDYWKCWLLSTNDMNRNTGAKQLQGVCFWNKTASDASCKLIIGS